MWYLYIHNKTLYPSFRGITDSSVFPDVQANEHLNNMKLEGRVRKHVQIQSGFFIAVHVIDSLFSTD